jgi:hypothetical protein
MLLSLLMDGAGCAEDDDNATRNPSALFANVIRFVQLHSRAELTAR